jgi:hypothetical protein
MFRSLFLVAAFLVLASAAHAQSSSITTSCERNARATKETCTTIGSDSTVTTTCVVHRGYWRWQSDKESCTTTTSPTSASVTATPTPRAKKANEQDAFSARYAVLRRDFAYGDSLVKAASARGDTSAVRRLTADQADMMTQLLAMSDTAAKSAR